MKQVYVVSRWTPVPCVAFVGREAAETAAEAANGQVYEAPLVDAFCGLSEEYKERFDDYKRKDEDHGL